MEFPRFVERLYFVGGDHKVGTITGRELVTKFRKLRDCFVANYSQGNSSEINETLLLADVALANQEQGHGDTWSYQRCVEAYKSFVAEIRAGYEQRIDEAHLTSQFDKIVALKEAFDEVLSVPGKVRLNPSRESIFHILLPLGDGVPEFNGYAGTRLFEMLLRELDLDKRETSPASICYYVYLNNHRCIGVVKESDTHDGAEVYSNLEIVLLDTVRKEADASVVLCRDFSGQSRMNKIFARVVEAWAGDLEDVRRCGIRRESGISNSIVFDNTRCIPAQHPTIHLLPQSDQWLRWVTSDYKCFADTLVDSDGLSGSSRR